MLIDVKRKGISLFAKFHCILLCSLHILLNLKLNVKNVNINVDIETNDCPIK